MFGPRKKSGNPDSESVDRLSGRRVCCRKKSFFCRRDRIKECGRPKFSKILAWINELDNYGKAEKDWQYLKCTEFHQYSRKEIKFVLKALGARVARCRVARWFILRPKNPNLGIFLSVLQWKMVVNFMVIWSILLPFRIWPFGIFCGHFGIISHFGMSNQEKSCNPVLKALGTRVARWYIFIPNPQLLVYFGRP
jgi:hypothetical protein